MEKADFLASSTQTKKKEFFDFDHIDYYFNNYDKSKLSLLYDNKSKSELDSLKMGIIRGHIPTNISDSSFIAKLEQIGYNKISIDKSKFEDINKIFVEKPVNDNYAAACKEVYRDILILKKNNTVIGIAKICFDCMMSDIHGSSANTDNFGQDGDYKKLENILRQ
ncbi:MAG: hypothetical protein V4547_04320 [Bacteroidota bacterium]